MFFYNKVFFSLFILKVIAAIWRMGFGGQKKLLRFMLPMYSSPLITDHSFRIVVYKDDLLNAVVRNSAKPFNFHEAYELSEEEVRIKNK